MTIKRRNGTRKEGKAIYLTDLDFADDIALTSSTVPNAQQLLDLLEKEAEQVGLKINGPKTKALLTGIDPKPGGTFKLKSGPIEDVNDFCYLGSCIRTTSRDFEKRKEKAWLACRMLWRIWKSQQLDREFKLKLFRATVESILLYGANCWTLTAAQTRSLDGTYTRLLRKALDISFANHLTNEQLYQDLPKISDTLRQRRLRFAGRCYRRKDQPIHDLLLWRPKESFHVGHHRNKTFISAPSRGY